MDRNELKTSAEKISRSRGRILSVYPFFGRLIMRLGVGFEDCGTAYTDMRRVVFDPAFIKGMDDTEMDFLFLHELMHCVLKHCVRGRGKVGLLYNVACDIVVNSLIMEAMGLDNGMKINGYDVMHLAPDGNEGREYTADAVYEMLKNDTLERLKNKAENGSFDDHAPWDDCLEGELLDAEWDEKIKDAAKAAGNTSGIPHRIARMLEKVSDKPVIHWRQVLQDFIRFNKGDYTFSPPDRRFSGEDYFLPAFAENVDGMFVNKLWFAVDTSGSVNNKDLALVMNEIRTAAEQIGDLSGYISFFDTKVSEPVEFDSCEELDSIKPIGGGGTSFESIFKSMPLYFEDELPRGLIIMTDGYASFPDESEALGVPVIWIIVKSNVVPPWGEYVKID